MFQHLLVTWGQTTSPKCSKLAPSSFLAPIPSVKWALMWALISCETPSLFSLGDFLSFDEFIFQKNHYVSIHIAQESKKLKNFNNFFAFIVGLSQNVAKSPREQLSMWQHHKLEKKKKNIGLHAHPFFNFNLL
jgi:hypothetical protein